MIFFCVRSIAVRGIILLYGSKIGEMFSEFSSQNVLTISMLCVTHSFLLFYFIYPLFKKVKFDCSEVYVSFPHIFGSNFEDFLLCLCRTLVVVINCYCRLFILVSYSLVFSVSYSLVLQV